MTRARLAAAALAGLVAIAAPGGPSLAQQRLNVPMHASAAERLAMLAERVAKSHLQVAQGVLAASSRRALRDSVAEFDALAPLVAANAPDAEAQENFTLLRILWKDLRAWALRSPTREHARQVSERAEEVSWVASKGARMLKADGTAQRAALAAMRGATVSQRIARLELQRRMGRANDARPAQLDSARASLAAAFVALQAGALAPDAADELHMAQTQHEFLLQAMAEVDAGASAQAIERLARTADYVAESLDRLARLVEGGG